MSGIVTGKDSNWLMSCTFNRQSQFRNQPKGQLVGWIYGLFSDKPGNFVKKKRSDCTGKGPYITAVCKTTDFLNAVDIIVISSHTNSLSTFAKDIFLYPRSTVIENIEKMGYCGNPTLGGIMYACPFYGNFMFDQS